MLHRSAGALRTPDSDRLWTRRARDTWPFSSAPHIHQSQIATPDSMRQTMSSFCSGVVVVTAWAPTRRRPRHVRHTAGVSDPLRSLLAAPPDLPVTAGLAALDEALRAHGAAVVHAPPGTGKTTLVPPAVAEVVAGRVVVT